VKFQKLHRVTFTDLREDQHLKTVVANIAPREVVNHAKRTRPHVEIARLVLASCSLPLFFPAVTDGEDEVLDGGIFSNIIRA
jgi:predicted acylesterase/phospholipase RssA